MEDGFLPELPPPLKGLGELASNLWWTWHPEAIDLWRAIDPKLWRESRHSPLALLKRLGSKRLSVLAKDRAVLIRLHQLTSELDRYLSATDSCSHSRALPLRLSVTTFFGGVGGGDWRIVWTDAIRADETGR